MSRWSGLALCVVVTAAYAPSLRGGFLEWDDGWLVRDNPWMQRSASESLPVFWGRFDPATRVGLGAEYLPVRDTVVWAEVQLLGLRPVPLRAMTLAWYLLGMLLLRAYLRRIFADTRAAEAAMWLFALHPIHVEGVAWISSHKDLLAFDLVAAGLLVHAGRHRARTWIIPLLFLAAHFAKGASVCAIGLLLAHDLYAGRGLRKWTYVGAAAVALFATGVHFWLGTRVGMQVSSGTGGRIGLMATMGGVWMRDLAHLVWPTNLSALYHVPDRGWLDPVTWLGWACIVLIGLVVFRAWRRGHVLPLLAFAWLVVPRIPTSQILVPLQNRMADRYLFWSALAIGITAGAAFSRWRKARPVFLVLCCGFFVLTFQRSSVFASNVNLWKDTSEKLLSEIESDPSKAPSVTRVALGNYATALAAEDRLREAELVYRVVLARWPDDPKAWNNLAELLGREGRVEESRQAFLKTIHRFPDYELAKKNYRLHFGELP